MKFSGSEIAIVRTHCFQNVDEMTTPNYFKMLPAAAALITLTACGSSSDPELPPLASQAIDGYIVGATVFCDGEPGGFTGAGGHFECPAGTLLSSIQGGSDVGLDAVATSGGVPFTGVLTAPASAPYVTPLTTLSVTIAQSLTVEGENFDLASYNQAQADLATTLGVDLLALFDNPIENIEAAKSNAQIHQVLVTFAPGEEDYTSAASALAEVILESAESNVVLNLAEGGAEAMSAINEKLAETNPALALAPADLDEASSLVVAANIAIASAESPARVAEESRKAVINLAPVTIVRENAMVSLNSAQTFDLDDFENPTLTDGVYTAQIFSDMTRVEYDSDVFQFNRNIDETQVTVAFELKSVSANDQRSITFVSDEVVVTAFRDNPESLVVSMLSDDSTVQVTGTDMAGVVTEAVIDTNGETISSSGDSFTINLERVNDELSDLGFEDILATSGNYTVTLVISGLRINEREGNEEATEATEYTIDAGETTVTGSGFSGYISIIR